MTQQSHVPKFGDWDNDNIPYTAYFESARVEKASGAKFNPNDPEDNPEAFKFEGYGDRNPSFFQAAPADRAETHKQQYNHRRKTSDQKSFGHRSRTSESGSDRGSSDYPIVQPNHLQTRPDRKKSKVEASSSISRSSGHQVNCRSNPSDDFSYKSASIPKFGEWDEMDPKSGEGFTIIFNKLKEEKHIAAAKCPSVNQQNSNHTNKQTTGTKSKRCCCLF